MVLTVSQEYVCEGEAAVDQEYLSRRNVAKQLPPCECNDERIGHKERSSRCNRHWNGISGGGVSLRNTTTHGCSEA